MQDEPRFSVVTASYNALEGLRRTVESVAAQTVPSVEHVVIDGGSRDGTREYLASLGDRIHWLSEPDEGIADALNKAVAMATGEYVIVLQAGDAFLDSDSVAMALPHLDGTAMVNFDVLYLWPEGRRERLPARPLTVATEFRLLNPHQGLFCHRQVFEAIGDFDRRIPIVMDYDHLLRAKHAGFELKVIHEIVSVMPADGRSSRQDWAGRHAVLADQAKVQWKNASGPAKKAALAAFWALFYPAYWLKWRFLPKVRFY